MATFNPSVIILSQKPIDENNYNEWKMNVFIVLEHEKIKYLFTTFKATEPTTNAINEVKNDYSNWQTVDTVVRYYIHASIANNLKNQISKLENGAIMIQTFE